MIIFSLRTYVYVRSYTSNYDVINQYQLVFKIARAPRANRTPLSKFLDPPLDTITSLRRVIHLTGRPFCFRANSNIYVLPTELIFKKPQFCYQSVLSHLAGVFHVRQGSSLQPALPLLENDNQAFIKFTFRRTREINVRRVIQSTGRPFCFRGNRNNYILPT